MPMFTWNLFEKQLFNLFICDIVLQIKRYSSEYHNNGVLYVRWYGPNVTHDRCERFVRCKLPNIRSTLFSVKWVEWSTFVVVVVISVGSGSTTASRFTEAKRSQTLALQPNIEWNWVNTHARDRLLIRINLVLDRVNRNSVLYCASIESHDWESYTRLTVG